jgi:hypothetical protein
MPVFEGNFPLALQLAESEKDLEGKEMAQGDRKLRHASTG